MALLHQEMSRLKEAEPLYRRALAVYQKNQGEGSTGIAVVLNNLANVLANEGRRVAAVLCI